MNWNRVLDTKMLSVNSFCQLIIVGETDDHLPFCCDHRFKIQELNASHCTVSFDFGTTNPLAKLRKVCFIELSFRDKGILYYAFVEVLQQDHLKNRCIIQLSAPERILSHDQRRYVRANIPIHTPLLCYIVGVREQTAQQGVFFKGQFIDLSGTGLSFVTSTRLVYPLLLQMNFTLPDHDNSFKLTGEILRVTYLNNNLYRISVEFKKTSEQIIHEIDQYCIQHYS